MKTVNSREDFLIELGEFLPYNAVCCEIGVLYGDFSEMILQKLNPETLVLVDPFIVNENKYNDGLTTAYSTEADYIKLLKRFKEQIYSKQIVIKKNYSYDAVNDFTDNYFDMVYIDGSHLYEDVKKDLENWLSKLKPNGIMAGHDYIEFADFGVMQAVDEFIKEHNFEMIILNKNGGDWALQEKK